MDKLLLRNPDIFSTTERIKRGMPLPDVLDIFYIAYAQYPHDRTLRFKFEDLLKDTIESGDLVATSHTTTTPAWTTYGGGKVPAKHHTDHEVHKEDYRRWLERNGEPLPVWWFPSDNAEPPPAAGPDSSDKPAPPKRTRIDGLRRAILAADAALFAKLRRPPTADEIFQYFYDEHDETGTIEDATTDAVTWIDSGGKCHDATRKTIANRLSRLRNPK